MTQERAIRVLKDDLRVSYRPEKREALEMAINVLGQPQIIRCKDCKYWQTNTQFCTRWSAPFATQHTSPDWYCADGKPKDGDGDG